jgi:hypothetical protein
VKFESGKTYIFSKERFFAYHLGKNFTKKDIEEFTLCQYGKEIIDRIDGRVVKVSDPTFGKIYVDKKHFVEIYPYYI